MNLALNKIDQAIQCARLVPDDTWYLSHGLMGKATFLLPMGNYNAVQQIAAEDLPLCKERGDRNLASYHWVRLARIALHEGKYDQSRKFSHQTLAFAQDVKHRRLEAFQYLNLGQISLAEGNLPEAVTLLKDTVAISIDGHSLDVLVEAHLSLRDVYLELAQHDLATNSFHYAANLCLELNWTQHAPAVLERLASQSWQQAPDNLDVVRWLAAADSWRKEANIPRPSPDQIRVDKLLKELQRQIPEATLTSLWQVGTSLSPNEALSGAVL